MVRVGSKIRTLLRFNYFRSELTYKSNFEYNKFKVFEKYFKVFILFLSTIN